jgi:hypothetical protein
MLARTGLRAGELCALTADAVVRIGATHWLRVPVGKVRCELESAVRGSRAAFDLLPVHRNGWPGLAGGGDLDGRVLDDAADIELEAFNDRYGVRDCLLKLGIVQVAVLRIAAGIDEDGDVAAVGEVEDVNPLRVYSAESLMH